jgi:hypothetical protein
VFRLWFSGSWQRVELYPTAEFRRRILSPSTLISKYTIWQRLYPSHFETKDGGNMFHCRSQWPRGLRHKMSSPAGTLGSWVRIPLEEWMFVCFYSVFVLSCVSSGLVTGWSLVQWVLLIVYKCKITELIRGLGPTWAGAPLKEKEEHVSLEYLYAPAILFDVTSDCVTRILGLLCSLFNHSIV